MEVATGAWVQLSDDYGRREGLVVRVGEGVVEVEVEFFGRLTRHEVPLEAVVRVDERGDPRRRR